MLCLVTCEFICTSGNSGLCASCLVSVFISTIICDYSFIFLFILLHRLLHSSVQHTALASSALCYFTITKVCVKFWRWKYMPWVTISIQEIVGGVVRHHDLVAKIKITKYFFHGMFVGDSWKFMLVKISRYTVSNKITRVCVKCPLYIYSTTSHFADC